MKELTSVEKGDASEATVIAELKRKGYTVLKPFGDNQRYDIAVEENGEFERIQIKTGRMKEKGLAAFETAGNHSNTKKLETKEYSSEEIDSFIVYIPEKDDCLYVPVEEAAKNGMWIRYEAEQDQPSINWAEDYRLEKRFE